MNAPDIFLSYNREDASMAKLFAEAFAHEGLEVWWDQTLRSGETYDEVTEAALRGAKAVVVLWSPRSVASHWVRAEATIAHRAKTLVPATIEPCDKPVMFELTQTAELSRWRGEAGDPSWLAFLSDVRGMVRREVPAAVHPAPTQLAPEYELPLVAVIPFTHRAGDEDMEMLAEDLTEDVTRELAQKIWFEVIAASKMAVWRGKPVDSQALGRQLNVRYLIEGKLQRAGEDARLTVQLIDADSAKMVWSSRMALKLSDIATLPEAFTASVAAEVGGQIEKIETNAAMAKPGPHSALEHVLRALAYIGRQGSDSSRLAIAELRQSLTAAPDNARTHALLASMLSSLATDQGEKLDDAQISEIQTHIRRAMQLDGDNPTVITGVCEAYRGLGEYETALRLAQRVVELYPNSYGCQFLLGSVNLSLGRTAEVIAAYPRQVLHSSFDLARYMALTDLGMSYLLEGQPDEAKAALDRALAFHPDYHLALKWKAIVAAHRSEEAEALAAVKRLRVVEPAMTLEQHIWQIVRAPKLAELTAEHVVTLRRLWEETGGDG
jgi:TolB-like protein/Tfp pilus assembly protein PilF